MSRKGKCDDNAPRESANGTIKPERVYGHQYQTRAAAKVELVAYFGYDTPDRRHSALGYQSPAEVERQWQSQQHPAEGPPTTKQGDV